MSTSITERDDSILGVVTTRIQGNLGEQLGAVVKLLPRSVSLGSSPHSAPNSSSLFLCHRSSSGWLDSLAPVTHVGNPEFQAPGIGRWLMPLGSVADPEAPGTANRSLCPALYPWGVGVHATAQPPGGSGERSCSLRHNGNEAEMVSTNRLLQHQGLRASFQVGFWPHQQKNQRQTGRGPLLKCVCGC